MPRCRFQARLRMAALTMVLAAALTATGARAQTEPDASVDALASQLKGSSSALSRLQLSGFADFSYSRTYLTNRGSAIGVALPEHGSFAVGNINMYLDAALSARARSLVEIRFTYLPNGAQSTTPDAHLQFPRTSTAVSDYTTTYHPLSWGGIAIERAFVEYTFHEALTVRAGQFLTPYGIWNVDHGSPAIVSVFRPYIVSEQLIPEAQVGLEAYGARYLGDVRLGYHVTLSNGRMGDVPQYVDLNGQFGYGGRVVAETGKLGDLRVGVSGYAGRYTNSVKAVDPATRTVQSKVVDEYDEYSVGADVKWVFHGLDFSSETILNHRKYRANNPTHKATVDPGTGAPIPGAPVIGDSRYGMYAVLGYRLPFLPQLMPYVKYEYYRRSTQLRTESAPDIVLYFGGVNYHLQPNLVLKGELEHAEFKGVRTPPYDSQINAFSLQTAWAF